MNQIRVVHVITALSVGGAQTALWRLLAGSDRTRFPSSVVTLSRALDPAERIRTLDIEVVDLGMRPGVPQPVALVALARYLRAVRPHVVQSWLYHADLLATLAAPLSGRPKLLWNIRCSDMRPGRPLTIVRALAALSRRPDAVVANSRAGLEYHIACGYRPRRAVVIPNGFSIATESEREADAASVRDELRLPPRTPLVGLMARYHPMKDHQTFFRAAAILASSRPDVHFMLAGEDVTEANAEIAHMAGDAGLAGRVHLLGKRSDVLRLTRALDIASLSSAYGEGFPNVVGEAMASGTPCVVTDVGDAAWIIGDSGKVVAPGDPMALAAAWEEILALSPRERRALGERGRARVAQTFSESAVQLAYEALYTQVAEG